MTIQGMSFYDFIGKLIPGILLWSPWIISCHKNLEDSFLAIIIIFVGFYLTGILWDFFINLIFKDLRLRKCMLIKAKSLFFKHNEIPKDELRSLTYKEIKKEYKRAYTIAQENNLLGSATVLEAQENFLKNIWFLIGYYIFIIIFFNEYFTISFFYVLLFCLILSLMCLPFMWYKTQIKIYEIIWEAEWYYNKLHKN